MEPISETASSSSPLPGLAVVDYFTPFNQLYLDQADIDLGSSGAVLLPDLAGSLPHQRLLVSAGKEGRIYLLDRDRMGHFNPAADSQIVQSIEGAVGPVFGAPAYFNGTVYFSAAQDKLKAFSVSKAHIEPPPLSQSSLVFNYPGGVPAVSANGSSNGIVWVVESGYGGTLHAYDASNLANELYNSQMNSSRDALGPVREVLRTHRCHRKSLCRYRKCAGRLRFTEPAHCRT